ncbi:carbohydrate-binding protein [Spirosoma koreense]
MNYRTTIYLALVLLLLNRLPGYAQGCSDAGFCTIGALKQHGATNNQGQKITLLLPIGLGDEAVFVFAPGIQYDNQLSARWAVQAKLTGNYASGNLGTAAGPGDVILSGTFTFPAKAKWATSLTLGTKLPLNQGNLKAGGQPLPMQYQSSLGTVDLITGLSVSNSRWQFSAGWQQPLTGANGNTFLPGSSPKPEAPAYPPSNQFNRKADVLVRAAYTWAINDRLSLNGGLLGIYHVGEDTYVNTIGNSLSISGSQGLTLNATLAGWWTVSSKMRLGFTAGTPLLTREVRPDGLTRSIVFAPEISWLF